MEETPMPKKAEKPVRPADRPMPLENFKKAVQQQYIQHMPGVQAADTPEKFSFTFGTAGYEYYIEATAAKLVCTALSKRGQASRDVILNRALTPRSYRMLPLKIIRNEAQEVQEPPEPKVAAKNKVKKAKPKETRVPKVRAKKSPAKKAVTKDVPAPRKSKNADKFEKWLLVQRESKDFTSKDVSAEASITRSSINDLLKKYVELGKVKRISRTKWERV